MKIYRFPFSADVKFFSISKYHINHDLLDLILQKLPEVGDQIKLTTLNSFIFNRLIIKQLNFSNKGNDQLLQSINCYTDEYLWAGLIELNAWDNKKITNVSFMASNLRILQAFRNCGITQAGIQGLQLVKLKASYNEKITDVSFMASSLRILFAYGYNCGIDQVGIRDLQLAEFDASDNEKIKDVNFMASSLRILNASRTSGIDQASIQNLRLIKLKAWNNEKITTKSFDHTRK